MGKVCTEARESGNRERCGGRHSGRAPSSQSEVAVSTGTANRHRSRWVGLSRGGIQLRDEINTNSRRQRTALIAEFAKRLGIDADTLSEVDGQIVAEADRVDEAISQTAENTAPEERRSGEKESKATAILAALPPHKLFHTPDNTPFISIELDGHTENLGLRSSEFRTLVAKIAHEVLGSVPSSSTSLEVIRTLEGRAIFDGAEREVFLRIAGHEGNVYVDLGTADWNAVRVTPDGWDVIADPPIAFRRADGVKALPQPIAGGSIEELRQFVNLSSDDDFALLTGLLLSAYSPTGPYPIGVFYGLQGSAKSTLTRMVRELVDPNVAPIRNAPANERDLVISAKNGRMLCFDNSSRLSDPLSDALCRLATGSGFSTRKLRTDSDEVLVNVARPILANGIEEFATRPDLVSRSIVLQVPEIRDDDRRAERDFWRDFELAKPRILGAILTAVSTGLRNLEAVRQRHHWPRMADACQWVTAAESAFGWEEGTFLKALDANQRQAEMTILEACPLVTPLRQLLQESRGQWSGTARDLLDRLEVYAGRAGRRSGWPGSPSALSGELRRFAPNLRGIGVELEFRRESSSRRERIISIWDSGEIVLRAAG